MFKERIALAVAASLGLLGGTALAQGTSDASGAGASARGEDARSTMGPLDGRGKDDKAMKESKKGAKRSKKAKKALGRSGASSSAPGDSQAQTSGAAGVSPGTGRST